MKKENDDSDDLVGLDHVVRKLLFIWCIGVLWIGVLLFIVWIDSPTRPASSVAGLSDTTKLEKKQCSHHKYKPN